MSVAGFVKGRVNALKGRLELARLLRLTGPHDFPRSEWKRSLVDPTGFYLDVVRHFHSTLPEAVRQHRVYFSQARRGFGEDAFHVLWHLLVKEFKPANFLEIGVYRGQICSLVSLLAKLEGIQCDVCGISPFSSAGDSVSAYDSSTNYYEDTLSNFEHFGLPRPVLLKAFSTDPAAKVLIDSRLWSAVYIDGNHEFEVARSDWNLCSARLEIGGIIVLDDSALHTKFRPPSFSTAGHPGPSKLADEIDRASFEEILQIGHNRVFQKRA